MVGIGAVTVLAILAVGTAITVVVLLYYVFEYLRGRAETEWELGISYLVKEKGYNRGISLFHKLTEDRKRNGMVITRTFPDKISKSEMLDDINILWLSREESPYSIDPTSLAKLTHLIRDFIRERESAVVFLDGLEYLIMHNGFETTLRFLQALNDLIILNNATLIIPLDPSSLSVKQLSLLEKEMEVHRLSMNVLRLFGD
ncbi:MAG: DUF835 domain-containing protein [Theionarchaea archaeon]|nr:DUF835 domain-containing protein [Theionarchaea archaeon]MBU7000381.1 DUF835 domain-containing protein [Theionarchaea archaeon]MBU7021223.1 DUF835 domain-containing protein [Theionarchaea archaeon]MBU7035720.1 DUF835 domain-containing protein [Theionarchaea archaeon]MBU7039715.1 DUF835 domain-containing protein [Theionarchaea archaeon]